MLTEVIAPKAQHSLLAWGIAPGLMSPQGAALKARFMSGTIENALSALRYAVI
jgi:hypothetical protein